VPFEQTLKFLQEIQREGLVKHIGLSEVSVAQIKKAQEYVPIVPVQNMYSVESRKWEAELQYCQENNMAFIPWYPLSAGNIKAMEKLSKIAQKHQATPHQIALSWLLHHSPNILLIPGTSKVKHLEENYKAVSIALSKEEMHELEQLRSVEVSG
jgi:pyridoxine 4-dehydrogenase